MMSPSKSRPSSRCDKCLAAESHESWKRSRSNSVTLDSGTLSTAGRLGVVAAWLGFVSGVWLRRRPPAASDRARDRASLAGTLIQAAGFAMVWGRRRPEGIPIFPMSLVTWLLLTVIAVALALGSAWLGVAAIRTLGKQWSLQARITQNHELITSGPYRFVRHPIYT